MVVSIFSFGRIGATTETTREGRPFNDAG